MKTALAERNINGDSPREWPPSKAGAPTGCHDCAAGYQIVACQQIFPSRYGSQYIQVRQEAAIPADAIAGDEPNGVTRLINQVKEQYRQAQDRQDPIQAQEFDEANPWIRRTRWGRLFARIGP